MNGTNYGTRDGGGLADGPDDAALAALDRELSDLAASDRASARQGLEERVADASAGSLRFGRPRLSLVGTDAVPRRRRWVTPVRIAAGLGLAVTMSAAFLARRAPAPDRTAIASQVELDLAEWLAISGGATDDLATQITSLEADTSTLVESFSGLSSSDAEEGAL